MCPISDNPGLGTVFSSFWIRSPYGMYRPSTDRIVIHLYSPKINVILGHAKWMILKKKTMVHDNLKVGERLAPLVTSMLMISSQYNAILLDRFFVKAMCILLQYSSVALSLSPFPHWYCGCSSALQHISTYFLCSTVGFLLKNGLVGI